MSDINYGTLYDMQKRAAQNFEPLEEKELQEKMKEVGEWMTHISTDYFMLLCKERSDYTILHINDDFKWVYNKTSGSGAIQEIVETLQNRGDIVDIDYIQESDAYEFWIKDNETSYMFMLFDCNSFIIEI